MTDYRIVSGVELIGSFTNRDTAKEFLVKAKAHRHASEAAAAEGRHDVRRLDDALQEGGVS
jgi:hypothetical protein